MATKTELDTLAHNIAYEACCSTIETNCVQYLGDFVVHWDTRSASDEAWNGVMDAVAYLEKRGLVERHAQHPHWVQLLDEGEPKPIQFDPEPIDNHRKIFVEADGRTLRIDGVRVSTDFLIALVNPDPARLVRMERVGDTIHFTAAEVAA